MRQRAAVDRAAQVLEPLDWPGARRLGVHHPRLAIELLEPVGAAGGGAAPGSRRSAAQGLLAVGLWSGREALGAADRAPGRHRAEAARRGGHPLGAILGQGASGYEAGEVAGRMERLGPGVPPQRRAAVATHGVLAAWEPGLADGAEQPGQQETFVPQHERLEGVRPGKPRVTGGRGEPRRPLRFHPLDRGPWLTCGPVAMPARARGRALTAARRAPFRMPPELRGAPGAEGVAHLRLGRRDLLGLPGGGAIEAEAGGDVPRWTGGA